ncbi:MAG: dual specificity protein phosphatase family protein [Zavarzinella sp.]
MLQAVFRWWGAFAIAAIIIGVPLTYYRMVYFEERRFRTVSPERFYRAGQLPEDSLRKKIREFGIKTIINLQDENQDPKLAGHFFKKGTITESELCAQEGVKFIFLSWEGSRGLLPRSEASETNRPQVIDDFLKICDDPANYPIMIHCKAGLHRTGALTAIYRMEYDGWSQAEAMRELRANGFGDTKCTIANDYIYEYIYLYRPRDSAKKGSSR